MKDWFALELDWKVKIAKRHPNQNNSSGQMHTGACECEGDVVCDAGPAVFPCHVNS